MEATCRACGRSFPLPEQAARVMHCVHCCAPYDRALAERVTVPPARPLMTEGCALALIVVVIAVVVLVAVAAVGAAFGAGFRAFS